MLEHGQLKISTKGNLYNERTNPCITNLVGNSCAQRFITELRAVYIYIAMKSGRLINSCHEIANHTLHYNIKEILLRQELLRMYE
jgi:hypothetical protein